MASPSTKPHFGRFAGNPYRLNEANARVQSALEHARKRSPAAPRKRATSVSKDKENRTPTGSPSPQSSPSFCSSNSNDSSILSVQAQLQKLDNLKQQTLALLKNQTEKTVNNIYTTKTIISHEPDVSVINDTPSILSNTTDFTINSSYNDIDEMERNLRNNREVLSQREKEVGEQMEQIARIESELATRFEKVNEMERQLLLREENVEKSIHNVTLEKQKSLEATEIEFEERVKAIQKRQQEIESKEEELTKRTRDLERNENELAELEEWALKRERELQGRKALLEKAQKVDALTKRISELEQQLQSPIPLPQPLKQDTDKEDQIHEELKRDRVQLQEARCALLNAKKCIEEEKIALQHKLDEAQITIANLQNQLKDRVRDVSPTPTIQSNDEEINQLQNEIEVIKAQSQSMKKEHEDIVNRQRQQIERLQEVLRELEEEPDPEIEERHRREVSAIREEAAGLAAIVGEQTVALEALRRELASIKNASDIDINREQLKENDDNIFLKEELDLKTQLIEQQAQEIEDIRGQLANCDLEMIKQKRDTEILLNKVNELHNERMKREQSLDFQKQEIDALQIGLDEQTQETQLWKEKYQTLLIQKENEKVEPQANNIVVEKLESDLRRYIQEIELWKSKYDELSAKYEENRNDTDKYDALLKENEKLNEQIAIFTEGNIEIQIQELKAHISCRDETIQSLQIEIEGLRTSLENYQKILEEDAELIREKDKEILFLQTSKSSFHVKTVESYSDSSSSDDNDKDTKLKQLQEELTSQDELVEQQQQEMEEIRHALEIAVKDHQKEIGDLRQQYESEIIILEANVNNLQKENERLQNLLEETRSSSSESCSPNESDCRMRDEIQELQRANMDASEKIENLQNELHLLHEERAASRTRHQHELARLEWTAGLSNLSSTDFKAMVFEDINQIQYIEQSLRLYITDEARDARRRIMVWESEEWSEKIRGFHIQRENEALAMEERIKYLHHAIQVTTQEYHNKHSAIRSPPHAYVPSLPPHEFIRNGTPSPSMATTVPSLPPASPIRPINPSIVRSTSQSTPTPPRNSQVRRSVSHMPSPARAPSVEPPKRSNSPTISLPPRIELNLSNALAYDQINVEMIKELEINTTDPGLRKKVEKEKGRLEKLAAKLQRKQDKDKDKDKEKKTKEQSKEDKKKDKDRK